MKTLATLLLVVASCTPPAATPVRPEPVTACAWPVVSDGGSTTVAGQVEVDEWPYHCSALKVVAIRSTNDVQGYYLPVRCVEGLEDMPGSLRADGGCVVGCQTVGDRSACFSLDCKVLVR